MNTADKLTLLYQIALKKEKEIWEQVRRLEAAQELIKEFYAATGENGSPSPLREAVEWKAKILAIAEFDAIYPSA
jgi:hypothetical protein